MARSLMIALLVVMVLWVGVVAYASSRLIWNNISLFIRWRQQTRDTRVRLALWLAVPLMKFAILLFSAHALWSLATGDPVPDIAIIRGLITAPIVLVATILMLWWVTDRNYGPRLGDRLWWAIMLIGALLGVITGVLLAIH